MSQEERIKLFILNNLLVDAGLRKTSIAIGVESQDAPVERAADILIEPYVSQFDFRLHREADRMAEYYRLFFMLENDIRRMVSDALSANDPTDWWEKMVPQNVRESAKKNKERELNEAISFRSASMIDYTTFGELGEIIKSNWSVFGGIFSRASIQSLEKVMARLNTLRGPIAHCSILSEDEVLRLKLTVRDWFRLME